MRWMNMVFKKKKPDDMERLTKIKEEAEKQLQEMHNKQPQISDAGVEEAHVGDRAEDKQSPGQPISEELKATIKSLEEDFVGIYNTPPVSAAQKDETNMLLLAILHELRKISQKE
jgi:hypothetical protein